MKDEKNIKIKLLISTIFALIMFFFINHTTARASQIECSDGGCSSDPSVTVTAISGTANYSTLWVSSFVDSVMEIITPSGKVPRDNRLFIRNGDKTKDLMINLSSDLSNINGGNSVIISDVFDNIIINSKGSSGNDGKSSTQICADSFKAGDYGIVPSQYWTDRDSGLDQNNCVAEDIDYLDSKFSCPSGYTERLNGNVSVTRIEKKKKCSALYNQTRCVKRTFDVTCKMSIVRNVCGNQNYSISDHGDYYISKPFGMVFETSECVDLPNSLKISGDSLTFYYRVDEAKLQSFSTKELLCNDLLVNGTKFVATFDYLYNDNGIWKTDKIKYKTAEFIDGGTKRAFYWPIPDDMIDSKGDVISPSEMRVVLKSWDILGLKNLKTYGNPRKEIQNCMGLDGSALDDFLCDRAPGPAFTIKYNLIDKYGALSEELTLNIPEGRTQPVWVYAYNQNWFDAYQGEISCDSPDSPCTGTTVYNGKTYQTGHVCSIYYSLGQDESCASYGAPVFQRFLLIKGENRCAFSPLYQCTGSRTLDPTTHPNGYFLMDQTYEYI